MPVLAGVLDLRRQVIVATGASLWSVDGRGVGTVLAQTRVVWLGREACLLLLAACGVIQSRGPGQGSRAGSAKMRTACDKCGNPEHIPLPPQARR